MQTKQISNSIFMKTNSYEEFQSIFIKYFESYQCFSFNKNLLKFIEEKNYFKIFEFLFNSGFLFNSEPENALFYFHNKNSKNNYAKYFKYGTLNYVINSGDSVAPKHYPRIFDNQEQWKESDIILQKYIIFQTIKSNHFSSTLENFIIEKIKLNTYLSSSIYYFIKISKNYNLRFIKSLQNHNLLKLSIEDQIFIFQQNDYFTDLMSDIIKDTDNFNSIYNALKKICVHSCHIPIHIFDYIMNNGDLNLVLKLNQISFSNGSLVLETKYYYTYDYSIVLSYLSSILNSKYLPELISKRYFIFNKEFVNHTINEEQIQSLFDDHFELLMQHSHNFSDKLDHLQEKFKLALMINTF